MTSIPALSTSSYPLGRSAADLISIRGQIDSLSAQLSSGRIAETFGGLGIDRSDSLNTRAILSALGGYDAAAASTQPRLQLTSASLTQISTATATLRNALTSNVTDSGSATAIARSSLESTIAALNQQINGQYVFGGRNDKGAPVASADILLDGDASDPAKPQAGLRTLVAEQIKADKGEGTGRLIISNPTSTSVQVREDADTGARANFGFTLAGAPSASGAFATIGYSAGVVEGAIPRFAQAPRATDHFRVVVNQPAGGQKIYDLTGADLADTSSAGNAASSLLALIGNGKIASVQSATPPGLTASFANGSAVGTFTINVATPPVKGDLVSIKLALRDGSTTTLMLQAQPNAKPGSTSEFAIGATPAETAQNLADTLRRAVSLASDTVLAASSTVRATQDFFAGQSMPGLAPRRIDFTSSTPAYLQTPSTSTVLWYRGEPSSVDPRNSIVVRTGEASALAIGARANEEPLRAALVGSAAIVVSDLKAGTTETAERWKALATRSVSVMPSREAMEDMSNEFGLAQKALSETQAENKANRAIHQSHLAHLESASTETVIAELLSLQNRLQASYQVTAMISKLSLVNYLR